MTELQSWKLEQRCGNEFNIVCYKSALFVYFKITIYYLPTLEGCSAVGQYWKVTKYIYEVLYLSIYIFCYFFTCTFYSTCLFNTFSYKIQTNKAKYNQQINYDVSLWIKMHFIDPLVKFIHATQQYIK